jgi:hypothetical protein
VGEFLSIDQINPKYLQEILNKKYTQADICELIEKSLLIDDTFTEESLRQSISSLDNSKLAIKECDFRGDTPFANNDSEKIDAPEEANMAKMGTFTK